MNTEKELSDIQKLERLLPYWINHNEQHMLEYEKWKGKAATGGLKTVARELDKVIALSRETNSHMEQAHKLIEKEKWSAHVEKPEKREKSKRGDEPELQQDREGYRFNPIGVIRTPYEDSAPYQPVANDEGEFCLCVDPSCAEGLQDLDRFRYIYVLYLVHRIKKKLSMSASPPWTPGKKVGLFASRSPVRPNPLGLSVVEVRRVVGNEVFTSGLDAFDGTPLLDIKPYIKDLDSKDDANYGWLEDLEDRDHLILHIKGIPHEY